MFRFALILLISLGLSSQAVAAVKWNNPTSEEEAKGLVLKNLSQISALSGLGINSMSLWSGAAHDTDPYNENSFLNHYKNLNEYGFEHVVLVSCADWIIELKCKKNWQTEKGILKATKLLLENTNLHIVLQLKAYKQKKINGNNISVLNTKLEQDELVATNFINAWGRLARELKEYPASRLSFNLLNEPEFERPKPTKSKRDTWLKIAELAALEIRDVSPDRTILIEGIGKSLFSKRYKKNGQYKYNSPDILLRPIDLDNVVYAFHNYEPEEFLQQGKMVKHFGKRYTKNNTNTVQKDAIKAIRWANKHQVPIIISETGCVGYLAKKEGPQSNEDCGSFGADIKSNYLDRKVGVSWWALEKEKTIFDRNCDKDCWMPIGELKPNLALFKGLGLNWN